MKTHRRIIGSLALVLVASAAGPVAARANPLLSGYGGPGQGSQAILGSTLLNGPGGGHGSSGAGGPVSQAGAASATPTSVPATAHAGGTQRARGPAPASPPKQGGQRGLGEAAAAAASAYRALERNSPPSAGIFGLSGADFAYVALGLAAIVFTGVLMRLLTRPKPLSGHG